MEVRVFIWPSSGKGFCFPIFQVVLISRSRFCQSGAYFGRYKYILLQIY